MNEISYSGYRFPPEIIQQAIWLYLRFALSFRDVEDLLAERGIALSYETVRRWVNHFGPMIAADLRKRRLKPHTTWHLDEVYLKIDGRMAYLWRAVDAEGEVLDVLVQSKRNKRAALNGHGVPHRPFKPDPEGRVPELLAVLHIRRQRGMHQLMREDSKHFRGIGEIGPDNNFMVAVIGRAGMPALSGHLSFFAMRCERDGKSDLLRERKTELGEIGPQFIRGRPQIAFPAIVVVRGTWLLHRASP